MAKINALNKLRKKDHQLRCEFDVHKHFSSHCRTVNKDNTEYRTSVHKKITLLQPNKENSEKKQTLRNDFSQ